MYADMEKPVATLSEWRPQGGSREKKRKERPTNQGPNIGCQEFSYLDATLGKSRAFSRKFFCRRDRIDTTRCMTRHVKSEALPRASKPDVMRESEVAMMKNNIISLLIVVRDWCQRTRVSTFIQFFNNLTATTFSQIQRQNYFCFRQKVSDKSCERFLVKELSRNYIDQLYLVPEKCENLFSTYTFITLLLDTFVSRNEKINSEDCKLNKENFNEMTNKVSSSALNVAKNSLAEINSLR